MLRVFISYRRDDSAGQAGRLLDRLAREFGIDNLFMDVDAIPLGVNFAKVLREEVERCDVLLAVIGSDWLNIKDEFGTRRLANPTDFVRIEISAALTRGIPVVPVLIDGAKIPSPDDLPPDLRELPERMGLNIRHESFGSDTARLIRGLKDIQQDTEYQAIPDPRRNNELISWVEGFRTKHRRNPTIPELQKAFPSVSKSTAWRYATRYRAEG